MSLTPALASQLQALRDRGVTNPDEFAFLDAKAIAETIRWFDAQNGRVGAGVLRIELRNGGRKPAALSLTQREADYGRGIVEWLSENFPELCDPKWGPHPAAVSAVIRLDFRDGKANRSKRGWGREIRGAVGEFDRRYGGLQRTAGA